ncbi:hypothetical protein K2X89_05170 [Myxococcota bacterium]|nr:hypothetical protein [Myxococcota bacterium]
MTESGWVTRVVRLLAVASLALGVAGIAGLALRPVSAAAQDASLDDLKTHWQGVYRKLRVEEARLIETARLATKEYADSNRRNYRRSGVRHFHRTNANEAKAELADVRRRIEAVFSDVVAAGGSVNWLYEVDDEPIDPNHVEGLGVYEDDGRFGGKGAYGPDKAENNDPDVPAIDDSPRDQADAAADDDDAADDGRNPLYSDDEKDEDEDDPASINEGGFGPYDYEYWRTNRKEYESERAPERHLKNDDY